jgi:TM2 domain-containing membrane protein YozV
MGDRPQRSTGMAYLLWLLGLVGFCGIHRFYLGRPISGLIWLFTGGLFFIGQIIDLFFMPRMADDWNHGAKVW